MKSFHAILIITVAWLFFGAFYYPKWKKPLTEATISWDVSGYYHYLPAIFIYNDLRDQSYMDSINQKYLPSTAFDQSFIHGPSGNKVNKYPIGQAILYSPFFFAAHLFAVVSDAFPADGYSKPYQFGIWIGGLLSSVIGLVLLRVVLLRYFRDVDVGWCLLAIGIGTHWIEYASINNGMNHTWLLALLCVLLFFTDNFFQKKDWGSAAGIGISLGLAMLTRPTEVVWILVPLLWRWHSWNEQLNFFKENKLKLLLAACIALSFGFIQLLYWKYASGEWIVWTYANQGFDWLHPAIWKGLMGVNIGWWVYTPMMLIAMIGWWMLFRRHRPLFLPAFIPFLLALYITMSWKHWEGGGGLGQRNLIQIYPLLAFPLTAFIAYMTTHVYRKRWWILLLVINIYYSIWWIHQSHKGGFFHAGQMNTQYFYKVAGRWNPDPGLVKLLDTDEYYHRIPKDPEVILVKDFNADTTGCLHTIAEGEKMACLNAESQFIGPIEVPVEGRAGWLRLEADFQLVSREWDVWKYAQWIVSFEKEGINVKNNLIRVQRLVQNEQVLTHLYFDVRFPEEEFDKCTVTIWNAASPHKLLVDNLKVTHFTY